MNGEVEVIENCGDNCYRPIYNGFVETNNAYLYAATNDIDGNGKPEVWIGGDYFDNGIGYTRIIIFEADGENNYVKVGKVDFIGVFSFNASNMQVLGRRQRWETRDYDLYRWSRYNPEIHREC